MILLISTCKEKLHENEFVLPIANILDSIDQTYELINYQEKISKYLEKADKIIICGTSLQDNDFLGYLHNFEWIKTTNKPVLGICSGMQIIGSIFGLKVARKTEIGFYFEKFNNFLGLDGKREVYHLHNNHVNFSKSSFEVFSSGKINQAVKHEQKEIYGVLFHPEVKNQVVIINFCQICD